MPNEQGSSVPLVSVVIPCYNQGHFLPEAIESALAQTYPNVEVVVVDDGSTDTTAEVASSYPQVQYVYHQNRGLSAARNTGVEQSKGSLLVFLDADDWLYPKALEINMRYMVQNEEIALVSGAYDRVFEEDKTILSQVTKVKENYYCRLLKGNYIGLPAVVMYRKWVFEVFKFDIALKACEDYDIYLNIFRNYPVIHHTEKIGAYRRHSSNMSYNSQLMLFTALKVLGRQKEKLLTSAEKRAYKKGEKFWKDYYCRELYFNLKLGKTAVSKDKVMTLLKFKPFLTIKLLFSYGRWGFYNVRGQ